MIKHFCNECGCTALSHFVVANGMRTLVCGACDARISRTREWNEYGETQKNIDKEIKK